MKEATALRGSERKVYAMKKILSIAIILVTVFALMVPTLGSAGEYGGTDMWVNCANGKRLNLRMDPSTGSKVITKFDCGTHVEVMEDLGNGWVRVATSEYCGYVQKKFLVSKKPGKFEITERDDDFVSVKSPYMVSAKALNNKSDRSVGLRVKPNKTSSAIRRLTAGEQLQVIAEGKTWSKVVDMQTGKTGYVANQYIQRV